MGLRAEDVFRPGAFPEYTYISRKSAISDLPYEFRLMQAIKVSGFLTSLVGPSKMGKTILCEKVIGFEYIVEISGADFDEDTNFWMEMFSFPNPSFAISFKSSTSHGSMLIRLKRPERSAFCRIASSAR